MLLPQRVHVGPDLLDPLEDAVFEGAHRDQDAVQVAARGFLKLLPGFGHELVAHPTELNRLVHPLFHALKKLRRAQELLPGLGKRLENAAADLLERVLRRRFAAGGKRRGSHFRHRVHPGFLERGRLSAKWIVLVAHTFRGTLEPLNVRIGCN
jgi:hypothetical protein